MRDRATTQRGGGGGSIPEPANLALVGIGIAGLASGRRRKTGAKASYPSPASAGLFGAEALSVAWELKHTRPT